MSEFERTVKPLLAGVPGWLTDEEGEALYELAKEGVDLSTMQWQTEGH